CSAATGAAPPSTVTAPPGSSPSTPRGIRPTTRACRRRAGAKTRRAWGISTEIPPCSNRSTASKASTTASWSTGATCCIRATSTAPAFRRRTSMPGACRSTASSTCWSRRSESGRRPHGSRPLLPDRRLPRAGIGVSPMLLLLLQLVLVLASAKLCGAALRHVGQPPVIGEMAAGLVLGPLVFGAWAPQVHAAVFPAASLPMLSGLGTLGVSLFMFIVGAELRAPEGSARQVRAAISIGGFGIVLPFALGLAIAPSLYRAFAPDGVGYWPFAMFIAAAISVTAFPVLARILKDRGLTRSTPGRLALGAGLVNDGVVWIFLAAVLALAGGGSAAGVAFTVAGAVALVAVTFGLLKPLYARLLRPAALDGEPRASALTPVLLGLLACAAFAEWIGLHAIFGAFLFGTCLPRDDRLLHWFA